MTGRGTSKYSGPVRDAYCSGPLAGWAMDIGKGAFLLRMLLIGLIISYYFPVGLGIGTYAG